MDSSQVIASCNFICSAESLTWPPKKIARSVLEVWSCHLNFDSFCILYVYIYIYIYTAFCFKQLRILRFSDKKRFCKPSASDPAAHSTPHRHHLLQLSALYLQLGGGLHYTCRAFSASSKIPKIFGSGLAKPMALTATASGSATALEHGEVTRQRQYTASMSIDCSKAN